ncbi:MAG TPA: hypothetical protein VFQ44_02450 [Streptosporangiaceae bacterium]|nr:hypothetical protein [Streptosporangiaceae bacterium]
MIIETAVAGFIILAAIPWALIACGVLTVRTRDHEMPLLLDPPRQPSAKAVREWRDGKWVNES